MAWQLEFSESAGREFDGLDQPMQERIQRFLTAAAAADDPSKQFARLHGDLHAYWKRREGHVRMIAQIDRGKVRILVLKIGKRDKVYDIGKAELKKFERDIKKS